MVEADSVKLLSAAVTALAAVIAYLYRELQKCNQKFSDEREKRVSAEKAHFEDMWTFVHTLSLSAGGSKCPLLRASAPLATDQKERKA